MNLDDYIPSYDILVKKMKCTVAVALTYMELWSELCLEQWMNHSSETIHGCNRFGILLNFFETYHGVALKHYCLERNLVDSVGYSRYILTSLTIIHCMHRKLCEDKRFARLQNHSIHIPNLMHLFEFLVLPSREDMIRARNLYDYFNEFRQKLHPDLLDDIESEDAFGVYYAARSSAMTESIQKIRTQAETDKQNKIKEVNNAKQTYKQLMNVANSRSCEYRTPVTINNVFDAKL